MASVEFRGVSKVFDGGVRALENLDLKIEDGEFVVVVGPSGCGKSTLLRLVAGLEAISGGDILIGGEVVNEYPTQERDIAMVFQNYALYPHKTVRKNLDFPLRMMKLDKEERARRIRRAGRLLGLTDYLDRKPPQLSGGQRQRVAMGRAIVRDPAVFLMDEPLSNLDAKLRVEIRAEVADLQRRVGITTLYVTHDQVEAMTLGERVAVLRDGVLQQVDPAPTLYRQPVNVFVATFIGSPKMNVFHSVLRRREGGYAVAFGSKELPIDRDGIDNPDRLEPYVDQPLLPGLRPEAFVPAGELPEAQQVEVEVHTAEALGHEEMVYFISPVDLFSEKEEGGPSREAVEDGEAEEGPSVMVARLPSGRLPRQGETLTLGVDTAQMHFFDTQGRAL